MTDDPIDGLNRDMKLLAFMWLGFGMFMVHGCYARNEEIVKIGIVCMALVLGTFVILDRIKRRYK